MGVEWGILKVNQCKYGLSSPRTYARVEEEANRTVNTLN
jgi:hypothetical protein